MRSPAIIAPPILAAAFACLAEETRAITAAGADWVHVDVVDRHFVPNITIGPAVVRALRKAHHGAAGRASDDGLADPYLAAFAEAGADIITIHAEPRAHLDRSLQAIKALGKRAGVSLCPSTPEEALRYVMDEINLILVMTVNPGFGGQRFLASQLPKIRRSREMIGGHEVYLERDGDITAENARDCVDAGADVLVAGAPVFKGGPEMYAENIAALRGFAGRGAAA